MPYNLAPRRAQTLFSRGSPMKECKTWEVSIHVRLKNHVIHLPLVLLPWLQEFCFQEHAHFQVHSRQRKSQCQLQMNYLSKKEIQQVFVILNEKKTQGDQKNNQKAPIK